MDTEIVANASLNVVRIDVLLGKDWGRGSGIVIDNNGTILTCEHVAQEIYVSVSKKVELPKKAEILNLDKYHDLATIRCDGLKIEGNLEYNDEVKEGQEGFILGFPIGLSHLSLTKAIISAKGFGLVTEFQFEVIQVDARVNHGNSGGPLFTERGELAGIVSLKYIPFLKEITELENYVNSVPVISGADIGIGDFSLVNHINNVNEGIRRMSKALKIIQVGIGWVVPIRFSLTVIS